MNILAFDTSNGVTSLSLMVEGKVVADVKTEHDSRQAEQLVVMIEEILQQNSIGYDDLSHIAVNVGPGSFTGVRIGLACAKAIKIASNIIPIGVTSFEQYAISSQDNCYVALDARRGQIYLQAFAGSIDKELFTPKLLSYEEVASNISENEDFSIIGTGASLIDKFLKNKDANTKDLEEQSAANLIKAAQYKIDKSIASSLTPVYVRKPDAKIAKNQ